MIDPKTVRRWNPAALRAEAGAAARMADREIETLVAGGMSSRSEAWMECCGIWMRKVPHPEPWQLRTGATGSPGGDATAD